MLTMPDEDPPEPGKKRCATFMHIVPIGNSSKVFIDHGAANPAGKRAARHDRPRSQQAAHRTMSHVAEDDSSNRSGRLHPDIAHYEVRREHLRIRAVGSLRRLDFALDPSSDFEHLLLTADAIIKAAEFWAFLRQSVLPTSSPDALDADAILAGQAALAGQFGDTVTIATTNLAHSNRFPGIDVEIWDRRP